MKRSCALLASSVMAASSMALFSSSDRHASDRLPSNAGCTPSRREVVGSRRASSSSEKEKFAPRFDGLRFIETLVTAHR